MTGGSAQLALAASAGAVAAAAAAYMYSRRRDGIAAAVAAFERDGIAVVPGFATALECQEMMEAMAALVEGWDPTTTTSVFKTDDKQSSAQGKDEYFMTSGDAVSLALPAPCRGAHLSHQRGIRAGALLP